MKYKLRNWLLRLLAGKSSILMNMVIDGKKGVIISGSGYSYRCVITNFYGLVLGATDSTASKEVEDDHA